MTNSEKWPADGLEHVINCPVCSSTKRELLYQGLTDRVFFCAPGEWTLYRCQKCGSGYLDPRPTTETIRLAYRSYFTHNFEGREKLQSLSWFRRIRRMLANGYLNWRFGTNYCPASRLGILAVIMFPSKRAILDREGRHLPRNPQGRLLDIGCGNGSFVEFATRAGWKAMGIEIDPNAVAVVRDQGLDVREGDITILDAEQGQFDGITMSHVIEHLHNPIATLRACYKLLKPGGWIWIETPNLNSQGHLRYRANWLHLDPPRHLVLFTRSSLQRALEEAGFQGVEDQPYYPQCAGIFAASEAIARGEDPNQYRRLSLVDWLTVWRAERKARKEVALREFITVKAWKL